MRLNTVASKPSTPSLPTSNVRGQFGDQEGVGSKNSDDDNKAILSVTRETTDWIDRNRQSAMVGELEGELGDVLAVVLYQSMSDCGQFRVQRRR